MTLFIAQTDGTTTFMVEQPQVDLISISKMDTGLGFDEAAPQTIEAVTTVPVTYTRNETGPTPVRLNDLVNNVGFTAPPHIVIFAVDASFTLSDGTSLRGNGVAIPVGHALNPFMAHVATFYDITLCDNNGIWVDREGGGTTQLTTDVMLYHELSHCFHFVTGTTAGTSADEERNATIDENDMRDVRGLPRRNVDSHNGGCGGGTVSCCIVATLSTGSPYSDEIVRFRYFRENTLRRSRVGDDFFNQFHYHYYSFSPEIVRLMGHQPALSPVIRQHFVVPLLAALDLLVYYAEFKGQGLAEHLRQQGNHEKFASLYDNAFLDQLASYMTMVRNYKQMGISADHLIEVAGLPPLNDLFRYINESTLQDTFINWALVDILEIWVKGALLLKTVKTDDEINTELYALISEWTGRLPITSVWNELSRLETEIELKNLDQFVFDLQARKAIAERLIEQYPQHSITIRQWAWN